jgi:hypothetical protein
MRQKYWLPAYRDSIISVFLHVGHTPKLHKKNLAKFQNHVT